MILYCVTVTVDAEIAKDWRDWMEDVHIPQVLDTGYFDAYTLARVLDPQDECEQITFEIHYRTGSVDRLKRYEDKAADALRTEHTERYNGRFKASRRVLQGL